MVQHIDNTKQTPLNLKKSDAEMMQAVMAREREGWTRLTTTTLQYVRPSGYGFITRVQNEWKWLADRNGIPRKEGSRMLLESAMQDVQNIINA